MKCWKLFILEAYGGPGIRGRHGRLYLQDNIRKNEIFITNADSFLWSFMLKIIKFFFTFESYSFDWKQYLIYKESIIFSISSNLLQAYREMAAYQKYQRYEKYQIYSCLKVHLEPYPELRTGFYGQFVLLRNLQWLAFASYAVKPYDAKVLSACHEKIF